jgi:predicted DNA-binding transcriptional regulator AlpA
MSDDSASWDSANEFVELDEVAWILGVDRARVTQASKHADFPDPEIDGLGETLVGAYWRRSDVETWMRDRGIDPGDEGEDDPWDVPVDASPAARRYIREHGGRVFVWLAPVNEAWVVQKVSTTAPPGGPLFDEFDAGDFTLFLDRAIDPPNGILLRRRPWPFPRLAVRTGLERNAMVGV